MVHLTLPPLGPEAADICFSEYTEVQERGNLTIVLAIVILKNLTELQLRS